MNPLVLLQRPISAAKRQSLGLQTSSVSRGLNGPLTCETAGSKLWIAQPDFAEAQQTSMLLMTEFPAWVFREFGANIPLNMAPRYRNLCKTLSEADDSLYFPRSSGNFG